MPFKAKKYGNTYTQENHVETLSSIEAMHGFKTMYFIGDFKTNYLVRSIDNFYYANISSHLMIEQDRHSKSITKFWCLNKNIYIHTHVLKRSKLNGLLCIYIYINMHRSIYSIIIIQNLLVDLGNIV